MLLIEGKLDAANAIKIAVRAIKRIGCPYAAAALFSLPFFKKTECR